MRIRVLLALLAFPLVAIPVAATAKTAAVPPRPLLMGFQDEASFLWSTDRFANLDRASNAHASVLRITANWADLAPHRPSRAADPTDPAYRFNGLDDLVFQAQKRGLHVLLTVLGTPPWASSTHKENAAPKPSDLGAFCGALATRYDGRGWYPEVGLYSVWNEPNLDQFLHPQFSAGGADVAPRLYAGMARACYGAIKHANPSAQVALGETSPRGHDKPVHGSQASHSPGRFAQLVAAVRPRVRFDAWAHHPYAQGFVGSPTSRFRWPNVGIGDLARFESALRHDFGRAGVPLWITEFAYQTRPEHPGALSYAQQSSYLTRAFAAAAAVPDLRMFIWFVFRDTARSRWQSGVLTKSGAPKPSYAAFTRVAAQHDVSNPTLVIPARPNPSVTFTVLQLKTYALPTDPPLGMNYRVLDARGTLVTQAQAQARFNAFGELTVRLQLIPKAHTTYTVAFDVNDIHGGTAHRTVHLLVR